MVIYLFIYLKNIIIILFVTCTIYFKLLKLTSYLESNLQYYPPSKLVRVQIRCAHYNSHNFVWTSLFFFIRGKFSRLASILNLKCLNQPNYPTQVHEFHCLKHKIPKYLYWYPFSWHILYKPDSTKLDLLVGSIHVLYFIYSFKHDPSPCDILEKLKKCGLEGMGWFLFDFFYKTVHACFQVGKGHW